MKYINLFYMSVLSFISMYILMYIMVDSPTYIYMNLNQFYMASLMTVPMVLIELFLMKDMYSNKLLNYVLIALSLVIFTLLIIAIRKQTAITDKEFLRSMIPHHAGALLMCREAQIQDSEIKELCKTINTSQQREIDFMQAKLNKLESKEGA